MDRISSIFERFDPENSAHRLTSDVIGHVQQRASVRVARVFSETVDRHYPTTTRPTSLRRPEASELQSPLQHLVEASLAQRIDNVDLAYLETNPQDGGGHSVPYRAQTHPLPSPYARRVLDTTSTAGSADASTGNPKPKRKRIRIKTDRRREQCRTNQARYRRKQTEYCTDLEYNVGQLRLEIPLLEAQRSRLLSSALPNATNVVEEYFRVFSHGIRSSVTSKTATGPQVWLQNSEEQQQLVFLRSAMAPDVKLGALQGVEALVEYWKRYTYCFDDLFLELEQMTQMSTRYIVASAALNVTVSKATLKHIFPHLVGTGAEEWVETLGLRLLGQRLFLPYSICFEWGEARSCVVRMTASVDFLVPLLWLLGTLEDAAFVLERACITPDGSISGWCIPNQDTSS